MAENPKIVLIGNGEGSVWPETSTDAVTYKGQTLTQYFDNGLGDFLFTLDPLDGGLNVTYNG